MIGRANRFHGRGSFSRHYKNSKAVRSGSLTMRYIPSVQRATYRAGVVVSRKVSKSAVVRNRIRRRLYEHVRILSSTFMAPCDIVLIVYDDSAATMPTAELQAQLQKMCQKAGLTSAAGPQHAIVEPKE